VYNCTLSLTSGLYGVGGKLKAPTSLPPRETRYPLYRTSQGPGPVWTDEENLTPTGARSSDRPAPDESLYRLNYPGLHRWEDNTKLTELIEELSACFAKRSFLVSSNFRGTDSPP